MLIPQENEKDLKDIPASVARQLEIVPVQHMDEVLTHAVICEEGDLMFKENDITFALAPEHPESPQSLI